VPAEFVPEEEPEDGEGEQNDVDDEDEAHEERLDDPSCLKVTDVMVMDVGQGAEDLSVESGF
jgi:hypothetical protein